MKKTSTTKFRWRRHSISLRSKGFRVVSEQRRTKKRLELTPFFVRSLTLVLRNHSETLATQATMASLSVDRKKTKIRLNLCNLEWQNQPESKSNMFAHVFWFHQFAIEELMSRWINGLNCCLIKKKTYLRVFRTTSKDTSRDVSTGYLNTDTWMNALVFSFVSFGSLSES